MKGQQVFLLDLAMDGLMLLLALRLAGRRPAKRRLLAGALLGTVGARCAQFVPEMVRPALWFPLAGAMAMAAGLRTPVRGALLVLAAAGLLGGTAQAILGATGAPGASLAVGAVAALTMAASVRRARHMALSVNTVRVIILYKGRQAAFDALVDSGNCLRDYLTHWPVIVLPERTARVRLHLEDAVLRPLFAKTAGGRQMMGCLRPDSTRILCEGRLCDVQAVLGLSPALEQGALALLPSVLLTSSKS